MVDYDILIFRQVADLISVKDSRLAADYEKWAREQE